MSAAEPGTFRDYIAAFPVEDQDVHISGLLSEAEDALAGLLADDGLSQVGSYRWDLIELERLTLVLIVPVIVLAPEEVAA